MAQGPSHRQKVLSALSNVPGLGEGITPLEPASRMPSRGLPAAEGLARSPNQAVGAEGWVQIAGCQNPVLKKPSSITSHGKHPRSCTAHCCKFDELYLKHAFLANDISISEPKAHVACSVHGKEVLNKAPPS